MSATVTFTLALVLGLLGCLAVIAAAVIYAYEQPRRRVSAKSESE